MKCSEKTWCPNLGVSLQPIARHHCPNPDVYMSAITHSFRDHLLAHVTHIEGGSGEEGDRRISARTHRQHNLHTMPTAIGRDSELLKAMGFT